jgi:hypothetical protein
MTDSSPAVRAYQQWCAGDIDEIAALRAMQGALDSADRLIAAGEGQRALWRKRIEEVVCHNGGKAKIDGLAEYRMTEPYKAVSYERLVIEEVLHAMVANGDNHYAVAIEAARKVTERPGMLQIRRIKEVKR